MEEKSKENKVQELGFDLVQYLILVDGASPYSKIPKVNDIQIFFKHTK